MTITEAINTAWLEAYPDASPVTEVEPLIKRVISLADDRKCWLGNAKAAEKENARLQGELNKAKQRISDFEDIMSESQGVIGWHLNGDVATWEELDLASIDEAVAKGGAE